MPHAVYTQVWPRSWVLSDQIYPNNLTDTLSRAFLEKVQSGAKVIKVSDYPMFLYNVNKYTPGNIIYSGLFQRPLLLRFYQHVFTGPSSWQKGTSAGGKQARGIANNLKAPTPWTIAYVAIMVYFLHLSDKF